MTRIYGYTDPAEQAAMLLDRVRVDAYARAIAAVVRPGDVVLDIGSGSGVLAMLAAKAGARRVFAVERTGAIELCHRHVEDNGFSGVVEPIRADFADIDELPEKPRVVIGELLGHFAPAEQQHKVYRLARRLAAEGAVLLPSSYRLVFAAARPRAMEEELAALSDLHGLRMTALTDRLRRRVAITRLEPADLVGPESDGPSLATDTEYPACFTGTATVGIDGPVTAISVSFRATLAPGVELTSAVGDAVTHWVQTIFPLDPPLQGKAGEVLDISLWPRVAADHHTWAWRVRSKNDERTGDALDAIVGDKSDLLHQIGVRTGGPTPTPARLITWASILGVDFGPSVDVDVLARALLARLPRQYPDLGEARQEVLAMLRAADRAL